MGKVIGLVALSALLLGCETKSTGPTTLVSTDGLHRVQCGNTVQYYGPSVPDDFWKICNRVLDLDNERLKVQAKR